jgi:PAS domain S-box-containing protein
MLTETELTMDRNDTLRWAQTLVESMPQLIWTCSPDGACDYLSRQWVEFTGVPESEQLGTGWLNALHPDDRQRVALAWTNAVQGSAPYDLEYRIRRHDGVYRWFKTRGVPHTAADGTVLRWLGTCTDIDAQKAAEEQISGLLANISDYLFIIDRDWRYVFVNPSAARLAKLTPAEMAGCIVWDLFPREKGSKFESEALRAFETGKEVRYEIYNEEYQSWYEMDIFPHRTKIIVFGRDITAKRQFEQHLQQTAKLESLGVLAGGIAHDFNNLLVGIMGNISLALEILPKLTPVREMLEDAVIASERAALLTRQLLAYAGKGQFKLEPLDISALVRDTRQLIRAKIPSNVTLKLLLAENLPPVQGDFSQIQQVIMNLVINAAESFEQNRTGEIRVSTAPFHLVDSHEPPPGQYICLKVEDEGCGMGIETAARIFEPFFTTKFTGRGLGLAAVQGVIRSHRGSLGVESNLGKGSTFTVLLPVSTNPPG